MLQMFANAFLSQIEWFFTTFFNGVLTAFTRVLLTYVQSIQTYLSDVGTSTTYITQDTSASASATPGSLGYTLDQFYNLFKPTGLLLVGAAAAVRITRLAFDHKAPGQAIILDILPRLGIGFVAIGVAALPILHFVTQASHDIGFAFWTLLETMMSLSGALNLAIFQVLMGLIGAIIIGLLAATGVGLTVIIPLILVFAITVVLLLVLVGYIMVLWLGRAIMLLFCFATAPICLACAVYDTNNRFTKWWLNQFINALIIPSVLAIGLGITIAATSIVAGIGWPPPLIIPLAPPLVNPVQAVIANIILIGGMWYTGKVIHALVAETYRHGGVFGGLQQAVQMGEMLLLANKFLPAAKGGANAVGALAKTAGAGQVGSAAAANPIGNFYSQFAATNPAFTAQNGGAGTPQQQGVKAFQAFSQQNPQQASALLSNYLSTEYGASGVADSALIPGPKGDPGPVGPKGDPGPDPNVQFGTDAYSKFLRPQEESA
jgi:hypothetical protein